VPRISAEETDWGVTCFAERPGDLTPTYFGIVQLGSFEPIAAAVIVLGQNVVLGRSVTNRYMVALDHGRRVIVEA
jgi:hypothetical protein